MQIHVNKLITGNGSLTLNLEPEWNVSVLVLILVLDWHFSNVEGLWLKCENSVILDVKKFKKTQKLLFTLLKNN